MTNFTLKLPEVLRFLLKINSPLPDDTCLQRLFDFTQLIVTGEDLESSGIISFLEDVSLKLKDVDTSILPFSVLLCGYLGKKEDIFTQHESIIDNLLRQVKESNMIKDSSLGTAYFTCLSSIVQHESGIQYFIEQGNLDLTLDGLKHGESVFLQTSVRTLIKTLLLKNKEGTNVVSSFIDKLCNHLISDLKVTSESLTSTSSKIEYCYVQNLMLLFNEVADTCKIGSVHRKQIIDCCFGLCLRQSGHIGSVALETLKNYLLYFDGTERELYMQKVVMPSLEEHIKENMVQIHGIACNLYQWQPKLKCIVYLPSDILFGMDGEAKEFVKDVQFTRKMFTSLLVAMLDCESHDKDEMHHKLSLMTDILEVMQERSSKCVSQYERYLTRNRKVMDRIFQCLYDLLKKVGRLKGDYSHQLFTLLMECGSNVQIETTSFKNCMGCIVLLLAGDEMRQLDITSFMKIVEMKLCDMRWEIRDTTLEVINLLLCEDIAKSYNESLVSLCKSSFMSVSDGNSYVRASAISVIGSMVKIPKILGIFLDTNNLNDIVKQLVMILSEDSEAFARRSTVKTLHAIYHHCRLHVEEVAKIQTAMLNSLNDFDWEVKILVLDFWEQILSSFSEEKRLTNGQSVVPSYVEGLVDIKPSDISISFREILDSRFCEAMFLSFNDYENSVKEKACGIIQKFLQVCGETNLTISDPRIQKLKELDIDNNLTFGDEYNKNPVSLLDDIMATGSEKDEDNFVDCY